MLIKRAAMPRLQYRNSEREPFVAEGQLRCPNSSPTGGEGE